MQLVPFQEHRKAKGINGMRESCSVQCFFNAYSQNYLGLKKAIDDETKAKSRSIDPKTKDTADPFILKPVPYSSEAHSDEFVDTLTTSKEASCLKCPVLSAKLVTCQRRIGRLKKEGDSIGFRKPYKDKFKDKANRKEAIDSWKARQKAITNLFPPAEKQNLLAEQQEAEDVSASAPASQKKKMAEPHCRKCGQPRKGHTCSSNT
eukprot:gene11975-2557_t